MIIPQTKIHILAGVGIPQDAIENAQVAFVSERTWSIVAPYTRMSGVFCILPMPPVTCPLVDTRSIADDEAMAACLRKHLTPYGVEDLDQILDKLQALGAMVSYPVEVMPLIA